MRAMILILPFMIALPELVMAEAPPDKRNTATQERRSSAPLTAEEFLDLPDAAAEPKRSFIGKIVDDVLNDRNDDPRTQACNNSKTEMEKYENCWLVYVRELNRQKPPDLVGLLISKLRLVEQKRITRKISKEEAEVLRAEAIVQFENETARRASIERLEEQGLKNRELQIQILERDAKRRESDAQLRRIEYEQERLRREEAEERNRNREFLRSSPSQTDCTADKITNTIHCTTR